MYIKKITVSSFLFIFSKQRLNLLANVRVTYTYTHLNIEFIPHSPGPAVSYSPETTENIILVSDKVEYAKIRLYRPNLNL
jgi:hypothetical protein